jgi:hypothetical protein
MSRRAIHGSALDLARLPTEATGLTLYGAYGRDDDAEGPLSTSGDRREHRPDLKPLLCGLTVTAAGGPVWGHLTDGHQRDRLEPRFHLPPRRQHLPDLGEPLWVAESQLLAGEPLAVAAAHRLRFITLMPQTVGLRQALVEAPALRERPVWWEPPGRRHGERGQ